MKIEYLKYEDLEECHNLCEMCFHENTNLDEIEEIFLKYQNDDDYKFLVAKIDGKIVGYTTMIILHNLFDGKRPMANLWYVCVHPDYRKQGIGRRLFDKIEEIGNLYNCQLIYFTSPASSAGAHLFYESLGYKGDGERAFTKYFQ